MHKNIFYKITPLLLPDAMFWLAVWAIGNGALTETLDDLVMIAWLEMLDEPQLVGYASTQEKQVMKRYHQKAYREKVLRRVLAADIKQEAQKGSAADVDYIRLMSQIKNLNSTDLFVSAVDKCRKAIQTTGFTEDRKAYAEAVAAYEKRPLLQLGKQPFLVQ